MSRTPRAVAANALDVMSVAATGAWVPRRVAGTSAYSYIDYESAITEQNRNIKIIKPEIVRDVARQFIKTMDI